MFQQDIPEDVRLLTEATLQPQLNAWIKYV